MLIWVSLRGGAIKGLNVLVFFFPLSSLLWFNRGIIHLLRISVILTPLISLKEKIWDGKERRGLRKMKKKLGSKRERKMEKWTGKGRGLGYKVRGNWDRRGGVRWPCLSKSTICCQIAKHWSKGGNGHTQLKPYTSFNMYADGQPVTQEAPKRARSG